jgi:hypothetical protein
MRDKEDSCDGGMPSAHGESLRNRIRSDLERMGMDAQFSESVAQRLESTVAHLSPHEYGIVMGSIAAVYGVQREDGDAPGIAPEDIADVQRLMQGFGEEVQKLDEGLRMLSAYVSRLRKRAARSDAETLH